MHYAIIALLVLAACSRQPEKLPDNDAASAILAPQPVPAKPEPKPFSFDEKNELIDFHYGWSAEAAAIPQLVDRFRKDMDKVKSKLIAGAREDKAFRDKEGYDFNGFMSSTDYETAGESVRLLSLRADVGDYTGGAHGNHGTNGLLWDRGNAREIKVAGLFAEASNMERLLTQRWCDALNVEREKRRGEAQDDGIFDDCPKFDDLAVIPSDKNRNGQFEQILIVASPYVAGPYAEGMYEIELAVTADVIAALKGVYRDNFEVSQTQ